MPEKDKLEKLIVHRRKQEKKNDQLRVQKNKIEAGRLKVQITYLDWNKDLKKRQFSYMENDYVEKLEKLYNRQLFIQEQQIQQEQIKVTEKEVRKRRLENARVNTNLAEKDKKKQLHGVKQERARSFMGKAKSLSGGYRDNEPPQIYYKLNGLVPPEKVVDPATRAFAQSSFGGGRRHSSSSVTTARPILPKETPYGVKEPPMHTSRLPASASEETTQQYISAMNSSCDDDDDTEDISFDDTIRVDVRPSTAPAKRQVNRSSVETTDPKRASITQANNIELSETHISEGVEPEVQRVQLEISNYRQKKKTRPVTASAKVQFTEKLNGRHGSATSPGRYRTSLRTPDMLLFRRKSSTGVRSAPTSRRMSSLSNNGLVQEVPMSQLEQDGIRKKILQKRKCLMREQNRRDRIYSKTVDSRYKTRGWRSFSAHHLPNYGAHNKNQQNVITATPSLIQANKTAPDEHVAIMLNYMDRCDQGLIIANSNEAKEVLLQSSRQQLYRLQDNVREFASSK